eukprot:TRINITY_DN11191_c1_g1_i1.p1 TRINITY_DN11191_c1_g1~~TRINITY_DN11191_c1_g1_i1.p1  ORF type:complete len:369 (-),score=98.75 TRINITY_DN11191_c1_g1_i1:224-1330(-)
MASPQPLLPPTDTQPAEEESLKKRCCKKSVKICGIAAVIVFVLVWIVQAVMYYYAMLGCGPWALKDYSYPGAEASDIFTAEENLQPEYTLICEREGTYTSSAWDSIPSNEASAITEAPNGVWFSTWGPLFHTYVFQDVANSKKTVYMRRNLLRLGMSHRIRRCDGKGPFITFTEGSDYFINRIRLLFGMNQGMTFKIYVDDELVAVAEETQHGVQSLTFRSVKTSDNIASAVLQSRHFHGKYDQWLVKSKKHSPLPYFVADAAAVLFANHIGIKDDREKARHPEHDEKDSERGHGPYLLDAQSMNMSLAAGFLQAELPHEPATVLPPHWIHADDISAPMLALGAVFLVPLLGLPLLICCKNGDLKKLW